MQRQVRTSLFVPVWVIVVALVLLSHSSPAQAQIQLLTDEASAVRKAKAEGRLLLFWFTCETCDRGQKRSSSDTVRDTARSALNSPDVARLANRYFVSVQADAKDRQNKRLRTQLGVTGLAVAVTTPDGEVLARVQDAQTNDTAVLLQAMESAVQQQAESRYDKRIRPVLADPNAPPDKISKALRELKEMPVDADDVLIELVSRTSLAAGPRTQACDILASSGSTEAVGALLDLADSFDPAERALSKLKSSALDAVQEHIEQQPSDRTLLAYRVAARLSKLSPKPKEFWAKATPEQQSAELTRMRNARKP